MRQSRSRGQLRQLNDADSFQRVSGTQASLVRAPTDEPALLLDVEEVSQLVGISVRQVQRLKSLGQFPKEVRLGGSVRWRRSDIEQWVADGCPKLDNYR
ncbi:MAG TPA: AlpA family phage regulatory protein [Lacipirellulaceae bacterium]|nr:AlpA family phage regulatory protein [Lacipirellulaceae bacterium]HMP04859.1 AlpA family phage regulatory protein [Lacipirellulaceae bacterium]